MTLLNFLNISKNINFLCNSFGEIVLQIIWLLEIENITILYLLGRKDKMNLYKMWEIIMFNFKEETQTKNTSNEIANT